MSPSTVLARLETAAIVAIGAFAGANLRFAVGDVAGSLGGTLAVNVLASLLLGFLVYETYYTPAISRKAKLLVTTGFLSSLSTYSAFVLETTTGGGSADNGLAFADPMLAIGYVGATYALGFAAVLVGRWFASLVGNGRDEAPTGGASA
ncbi:Integral membrane protein possibly involved in chromosome condensation [Halovivax ruber XH-70]|uniref:Fluoride-specific ion channel FluC n=1 Tax=Halovivax ruber (strain DSM 18193 / JCM 13892 / XH-70) TaxID=797302 RepID=L0IFM0_HALRX|nr:CrcB family protein [Halovivax ruber]AGB17643.1 Integral membrane protein possibly involved in chromosome condensation [Halovivax ruber XH-70]